MPLFWWWLIALLAGGAAVATVATVAFWDRIREAVTSWLHRNSLARSVLMDAWVWLDRMISGVRARIFVKRRHHERAACVEEMSLPMSEIDDEDVLYELRRRGRVRVEALHLVRSR